MKSKIIYFIAVITIFRIGTCQISNNLDYDKIKKKLEDKIGPEINDLEREINESGISLVNVHNKTRYNMNKFELVLQQKCENQGAGDVVDFLKMQHDSLQACLSERINTTKLRAELDKAKQTGSMDEVFLKYCRRWSEIFSCLDNVTSAIRRCMTDKEKESFNKTLTILQDMQDFMCVKEGDRLALFVAEGGLECLDEKRDSIRDCINVTIGDKFPDADELSVATLPSFVFTEETCQHFDEIRICINHELEQCNDSTPANIIDALFKFLRRQMPCAFVEVEEEHLTTEQPDETVGVTENSSSNVFNSFTIILIMGTFQFLLV